MSSGVRFVAIMLVLMFVVPYASAAPKSATINVEIHQGEKTTRFIIDGQTKMLIRSSSSADTKSRSLASDDLTFMTDLAKKLPTKYPLPKNCYRSNMTVTLTQAGSLPKTGRSCFGMRSITSRQYEKFANLLAVAI